jgi:hypothetical protein
MQKLVGDAVEGKKVYDLVVEGDKAIESAAASVYNKKTKTGAIPKGATILFTLMLTNVSNDSILPQELRSRPVYQSTMLWPISPHYSELTDRDNVNLGYYNQHSSLDLIQHPNSRLQREMSLRSIWVSIRFSSGVHKRHLNLTHYRSRCSY